MALELMKGNEAVAEAAVRAGVVAYFGYPITPQTELLEYMSRRMPELGRAFVQAESELGAINMVYGAACTGHRVMTSSSSPGTSLMLEGISYIAGTELPMVMVEQVATRAVWWPCWPLLCKTKGLSGRNWAMWSWPVAISSPSVRGSVASCKWPLIRPRYAR